MNCKIKIFSLLIILSVLWAGCIDDTQTNVQTDYNLKYNLNSGDRFVYDTLYSTEAPKNTFPIHIEMLVSDFDGKNVTTKVTSAVTMNGNITTSLYNTIIDTKGNLIKLDAQDNIIPEIQPELPNLIAYPENKIKKGDSWTILIKKVGVFNESGTLNEYMVVGTKNYTWLDSKKISVKAGEFECAIIKSDVNFNISMKTETGNGTIYISTIGNYSGDDWVDIKDGFLVKSTYDIDQVRRTDLSEVYKKTGLFENFYRETLIRSHSSSELKEKKHEL
ncbi:MAG: hypothetical protein O8C63_00360 [Candidatus Methanoperedens sp.]|nr:hypothetical protein [Candidatus Methanoperedens sp.]